MEQKLAEQDLSRSLLRLTYLLQKSNILSTSVNASSLLATSFTEQKLTIRYRITDEAADITGKSAQSLYG